MDIYQYIILLGSALFDIRTNPVNLHIQPVVEGSV